MKKILSLLVSAMLLLSTVPAATLTANAEAGMSWQGGTFGGIGNPAGEEKHRGRN